VAQQKHQQQQWAIGIVGGTESNSSSTIVVSRSCVGSMAGSSGSSTHRHQ
jgi:hypothetical protein